jgi:hypothetical protein
VCGHRQQLYGPQFIVSKKAVSGASCADEAGGERRRSISINAGVIDKGQRGDAIVAQPIGMLVLDSSLGGAVAVADGDRRVPPRG